MDRIGPRPAAAVRLAALACFGALAASSAGAISARAEIRAVETGTVQVQADRPDLDRFHLARAAVERSRGNAHEVVAHLEAIDWSGEPRFEDADRAAFLLAQAYLEAGDRARFRTLATQVATWKRASVYTRWIALRLRFLEAEGENGGDDARPVNAADSTRGASHEPSAGDAELVLSGDAAADALAAHLLLAQGDAISAGRLLGRMDARGAHTPLALHARALAAASASDPERELAELARCDTSTALGRDLSGAAILRLAAIALRRGEDPRPLLETAPARGRHAARARHLIGIVSIERGDRARGRAALESALATDSLDAERRAVRLALAGLALDAGEWEEAHEAYRETERERSTHRAALDRMLATGDFDPLWRAWPSEAAGVQGLDELPAQLLAEQLARASTDLGAPANGPAPTVAAAPDSLRSRWPVVPPPADAWRRFARSEARSRQAAGDLERARWEWEREREALAARQRYFEVGAEQVWLERGMLETRAAQLDSLRQALAELDARLRAVRDGATRRLAARASTLARACAKQLRRMAALRHLHLEGPHRARAHDASPGYPSADSTMRGEEALAGALLAEAETLIAQWPGLIARSYAEAWRPGLIDRAGRLAGEAAASLTWARALEISIDSSHAAAATSPELRRLAARVESLERRSDTLRVAHHRLADAIAREAVLRTIQVLEDEREAIDYGLAISAYGLSVAASTEAPEVGPAPAPETPADRASRNTDRSIASLDEGDDPRSARWRTEAIAAMRTFLERHPDSFARGETRFRLADLLMVEARYAFRTEMERYVRDQERGTVDGPPPVIDHASALAVYRDLLEQDREFEHRDAALFNAGMILADGADPDADRLFGELVTRHASSPHVQEAWLRRGDLRFADRRYRECVAMYSQAAAGPDANLAAMALYKSGWAHFNEDRFLDAAGAFRAVLDLYGSSRRSEIQADIENEAHTYLVQSLAGAGGAPAFARFFDGNARPYERRVLLGLGQHFRRYRLHPQAIAADELFLRRYPNDADALLAVTRLIESCQRWDREPLARQARESYAPRFAPTGTWFAAQTSDSVKTAGAQFARASYQLLAGHHQGEGRRKESEPDFRKALEFYETMLVTWPTDSERAEIELDAGEASLRIREYPEALAHYALAEAGPDSIAARARWQKVAVYDAWYESTRGERGSKTRARVGRDSLARHVLESADDLLAREPNHPEAADLVWRQGNLALAHGWLDRAAQDLDRMATRHPRDSRAPLAAALAADARFELCEYAAAGAAYEKARRAAQAAGNDSLARRTGHAIPVCAFREADAAVAADSSDHAGHAKRWQRIAERWPDHELAHVAQYRAGLAHLAAGERREAITAMEALIRSFPASEYAPDAHLHVARSWKALGERERAAEAYARFVERFPEDPSTRDAWLEAADLFAAAGVENRAETLRRDYVRRYPDDLEAALQILEPLARRELAAVTAERPISTLVGAPPTKDASALKRRKTSAQPPAEERSAVAHYLKVAASRPALASPTLLAQVRFLEGEEALAPYRESRLTVPLAKSLRVRQQRLDQALSRYRKCAELGDTEWARASAHRIGQALIEFGDALIRSDRPADLKGDDRLAYDEVLTEKAQDFYDRGERVWSDLLRQKRRQAADDPWIRKTEQALWPRLGERFYFRPEAEYPLIGAAPPERKRQEVEPTGVTPPVNPGTEERAKSEEGGR